MKESVVADFVGRVHTPSIEGDDPVAGRVLLSQRRLVLATEDAETTVPLSSVFDVAVGTVPNGLHSFLSDTVTFAYIDDEDRGIAVVEGKSEAMERFTRLLFKALLRNVTVTVRHPAKVGGRVTDAPDRTATVTLPPGSIGFVDCADPFRVDLSTVIEYERTDRTLGGTTRPTLVFKHVPENRTVTTLATVPNERTLNILGRYIKLGFVDAMEEVNAFDPTEEQLEVLVSLYSAGEEADIADLVTGDATATSEILDSLREEGFVADVETGIALTRQGRMVVTTYLDSVNE